jgi:uncharacterized membrane protein
MPDRQKVEAILTNRFPGAPLPQVAAAVNAIMALQEDRFLSRATRDTSRTSLQTTIAVSTRIEAPITRVFDRFTDLEHVPEHVSGIVAIDRFTEPPFGVGSRWRESRTFLGAVDSADMQVTSFDRYRGYTISHRKAGLQIDTAFSFEAAGTGTLVAIEFSLDGSHMPAALLTPLNWAIAGKVRHVLQQDLSDLKAGLEAGR